MPADAGPPLVGYRAAAWQPRRRVVPGTSRGSRTEIDLNIRVGHCRARLGSPVAVYAAAGPGPQAAIFINHHVLSFMTVSHLNWNHGYWISLIMMQTLHHVFERYENCHCPFKLVYCSVVHTPRF
jgi:hypothetical protein